MSARLRMFVSTLGVLLVAFAGPPPATASRSLEQLVSIGEDACDDFSVGALSEDGQHLLITQLCVSSNPADTGVRGALWRNFRSSSDPSDRVWAPGFFVGLSGDGRSAVGHVTRGLPEDWTREEVVVLRDSGEFSGMGFLPGADPRASTFATAISADGSTGVGGGENEWGDLVPIRWSAATGLQEIPMGSPPSPCSEECGHHEGHATGVSHDGSVIVGNLDGRAFRWDAVQGKRPLLDDGRDEIFDLQASALSGDGSSIVGSGIFEGERRPFILSEATGLMALYDSATGVGGGLVATSISRDGSVVVGGEQWGFPYSSTFSHEDRAFIWTRAGGMTDLRTALEDLGIDTASWASLLSAWAVSGDGSTIMGIGYRFDGGNAKTFYASLLPAPRLGVGLCDLGASDCAGIEIVARSGQAFRYGVESSTRWMGRITSFSHAILNSSGEVAFSAVAGQLEDSQNGTSGAGGSVVFGPDGSGKSRICPISPYTVPALGISQAWLPDVDPRSIALLDDGYVYFSDRLDWNATDGIWRCRAGSNEVDSLAIVGGEIPDGSGEFVQQIFDKFQVDVLGRVSFLAMTSTPGPTRWSRSIVGTGPSGNLEVRLRSGTQPPGVEDLPYGGSYFHTMSSSGKLAFVGALSPFGQHFPDEQDGLWGTGPDGTLTLILRTGDPAPGFGGAKSFRSMHQFLDTPAVNARGDVVTTATLEGEGPVESSVWKWSPDGALTLIAREGESLPGLTPGRIVVGFDAPLINDRGDILLSTILDSGPSQHDHGYWLHTAEGVRVALLQSGQAAPALPEGVVLGGSNYVESPSYPDEVDLAHTALSESGLVLLEFDLAGPGVDATNDRALYLLDRTGSPTLVIRRGDAIPVAHQDIRTLADFRVWYGYRDGYARSPINDQGDVVAILQFVDGTQAVAKISVPEPEPWAMWMVSLVVLFVVRRLRSAGFSRSNASLVGVSSHA